MIPKPISEAHKTQTISTAAKPANVIRIVLTTHFSGPTAEEDRQARDAHKSDEGGGRKLPSIVASVQPGLVRRARQRNERLQMRYEMLQKPSLVVSSASRPPGHGLPKKVERDCFRVATVRFRLCYESC